MTDEARESLRQETRDIFYHGFNNYMTHAFPEDELRPIACAPLTRDRENPAHIELNDVLGNYSLTLIDSLSTLAILASSPPNQKKKNRALGDFQNGIEALVGLYGDGSNGTLGQGTRARGFDMDSKVQVFETVIRGVGGLLSAHLFAVGDLPITGYTPKEGKKAGKSGILWPGGFVYDGQLLRLALDLAERLLPAFHTPTGLPYPRVNLRHGVPFYSNSPLNKDPERGQCTTDPSAPREITETCSAGAGSLVLEFTTLSWLSGDDRFEKAAKVAFASVWERRSSVGLIGSGVDAESGHWVGSYTGIGAGIDSFFEYAFKSHVLLSNLPDIGDSETFASNAFLGTWQDAHAGIKRHVYRDSASQHPHYAQVDLYTGATRALWIDSLSAYYPGLLTFAGELDEAIETHLLYAALWTRYSALPERWSTGTGAIESGLRWWGGRPEFIESTWYLYRATKDPWLLHVGEMTLKDIKRRCWTKCGWAGIQDVRTGELSDRMESFFLGETAKYLYLLFDEVHPLNHLDAPFVFTTEGHPLIIPKRVRRAASSQPSYVSHPLQSAPEAPFPNPQCPVPPSAVPFSISATAARPDFFHAAALARIHLMPTLKTKDTPLAEYNADHPSLSQSDSLSPSNFTYYPWTLPPQFIPPGGMSAKLPSSLTFDLAFPSSADGMVSLNALQRTSDGLLLGSMNGLRLGMIKEPTTESDSSIPVGDRTSLFRIYSVSNVQLGRDEKVFMPRTLASEYEQGDPYFTRTRNIHVVDLIIDVPRLPLPVPERKEEIPQNADDTAEPASAAEVSDPIASLNISIREAILSRARSSENQGDGSFLKSLLQSIQNVLSEGAEFTTGDIDLTNLDGANNIGIPLSKDQEPQPHLTRHSFAAALPTGPGAAPLPDEEDPAALMQTAKISPLPWKKIFFAGTLCEQRLDFSVPREYNVIVIERGGCSFSEKLKNIPAAVTGLRGKGLKLVVIVDMPENKGDGHEAKTPDVGNKSESEDTPTHFVHPHLDVPQMLPGGIPRPVPIPMVMISGGEETMNLLRRAADDGKGGGIAVKRRWVFLSQGVRIQNLIVL
ncbi:glycoside hydrolase family 47 protein [Aulographum hederae CBS 113979]|uniref:alpha-1,2-Mannosidase n=1 Tax=Aulographum hederae CBS 113979 TaxID=1176131 RepID=A0A6G1HBW6_9PEZI|nr:glycoside hydrolase family 47 protein [Aulographum hederae CBS 113979]